MNIKSKDAAADCRGCPLSPGSAVIVQTDFGFGGSHGMVSLYQGAAMYRNERVAVVSPADGGAQEVVSFNSIYKLAEKQ